MEDLDSHPGLSTSLHHSMICLSLVFALKPPGFKYGTKKNHPTSLSLTFFFSHVQSGTNNPVSVRASYQDERCDGGLPSVLACSKSP